MARDVLITPASGLVDFLDTSVSKASITLGTDGILTLTGGANPIVFQTSTSGSSVLRVDGTSGTIFEVTDDLSNSLMSVNTIAGLPVFEVFADNHIVAGRYNQNDFYLDTNGNLGLGTSAPSSVLDIYEQSGKDNKLRFHNDTTGSGTSNGSRIGLNGAELFINNIENSAIKIYTQSTQTNGITILGNGNVGIGTTIPGDLVHIRKDQDSETALYLQNNNDATGAGTTLRLAVSGPNSSGDVRVAMNVGNGGSDWALGIDNSDNDKFKISGGTDNNNTDLGTNTRLTIDGSGNVGIGTTAPSKKLDVNGDVKIAGDTFNAGFLQAYGSNYNVGNNNYGVFLGTYSGGTSISPGEVILSTQGKTGWDVGDGLGRIRFFLGDSSGVGVRDVAKIEAVNEVGDGSTTTTAAGALAFYTSPYNSHVVERLRIAADGNIGMGSFVTGSPVSMLHVKGSTGSTFISVQDSRSNTGDVAGVRFSTSANATVNFKSFISHIETGTNGQGDLIF